jgi:hypothetical protein
MPGKCSQNNTTTSASVYLFFDLGDKHQKLVVQIVRVIWEFASTKLDNGR